MFVIWMILCVSVCVCVLKSKAVHKDSMNFMQKNFKNYLRAVASLRHIYFDDEFHVVHFFLVFQLCE